MNPASANEKVIDDIPFESNENELILYPIDPNKSLILKRVSEKTPEPTPIVGKWTYIERQVNQPATMEFTRNGQGRISIHFPGGDDGSYQLKNNLLTIVLTHGDQKKEIIAKVDGHRFTFSDDDREKIYEKFSDSSEP